MSRTVYFICIFSLIVLGLFVFKFDLADKLFPQVPNATLYFLLVYISLAMLIQALRRKQSSGKYFFNILSRKALANDIVNRIKGF